MSEALQPILAAKDIPNRLKQIMDQAAQNGASMSTAPYQAVLPQIRQYLKAHPDHLPEVIEQMTSFLAYASRHKFNGVAHHFAYDYIQDNIKAAQRINEQATRGVLSRITCFVPTAVPQRSPAKAPPNTTPTHVEEDAPATARPRRAWLQLAASVIGAAKLKQTQP